MVVLALRYFVVQPKDFPRCFLHDAACQIPLSKERPYLNLVRNMGCLQFRWSLLAE